MPILLAGAFSERYDGDAVAWLGLGELGVLKTVICSNSLKGVYEINIIIK